MGHRHSHWVVKVVCQFNTILILGAWYEGVYGGVAGVHLEVLKFFWVKIQNPVLASSAQELGARAWLGPG